MRLILGLFEAFLLCRLVVFGDVWRKKCLLILLLIFLVHLASSSSLRWEAAAKRRVHYQHPHSIQDAVRVAYWPAYAADRYPSSSINALLFTHLNYAFVELDKASNTIKPLATDNGQIASFSFKVKSNNPKVKTLISIGGGGSDAQAYSSMAQSPTSRSAFINSSIALARSNGFDGLDLDWEFPQSDQDMLNLGTLFVEWRTSIESEAKASGRLPLLLTAAVYYAANIKWVGGGIYPTNAINKNLDWVNIMCYDYHGSWEPKITGAPTALFDPMSELNSDSGITRWFAAGLSPSKAVLGLAMYGKSWIVNETVGIGGPAVSSGPGDGTLTFAEISNQIASSKAQVKYDNVTATAYSYIEGSKLWIGFDNPESIATKINYLKKKCMRGYFFWTASFDFNWILSTTAAITLESPF